MFVHLLGYPWSLPVTLIVAVSYLASLVLIAGALGYEHESAKRLDVTGINRAFFQSNAFVSAVFLGSVWLAVA